MIYCPECGYPNDDNEHRCEKCAIRFDVEMVEEEYSAPPAAAAAPAAEPLPAWHMDVRDRMNQFRQRRGLQAALPLEAPEELSPSPAKPEGKLIVFPGPAKDAEPEPAPLLEAPPKPPPQVRRPAQQQDFRFPLRHSVPATGFLEFPVAPVQIRLVSAVLDGAMVAIAYGLLFLVYHFMGGELPLFGARAQMRITVAALLAILGLVPLFYHFLFLRFSTGTPGMMWTGLRLVDFDGRPASRSKRVRRAFAAAASAGPFLLGFFWAWVDQEQLTWHDRMSETCLTTLG